MSDTQQGPDWWQASDGRWYPPEQHPDATRVAPVTEPTHVEATAVADGPPAAGPPPLWRRRWIIATAAILLLLVVLAALTGDPREETDLASDEKATTTSAATAAAPATVATTLPTVTAAPATTVRPTTAPTTARPTTTARPDGTFGDGKHVVGSDVQPGVHRTRKGSSGCYWARLSGFGGTLDEIKANENTDDPAIVEIAPDDKGFESKRCGTWTKDLSAITTSRTSFSGGTYIVGTDMEPGTYQSSGGDGCYWARLSNFSGELSAVLANDNTDGPTVVTISASDKGFTSRRCGTWTKTG